MAELVQRYTLNTTGRDLIVGDIRGHFTKLQRALDSVGFNPNAGDRLFSVGDLVDRGPESGLALQWLRRPWFHAVQGNHEEMAVSWASDPHMETIYRRNGGDWNIVNTPAMVQEVAERFAQLPVVIELQTAAGLVGIVHADCPFEDWVSFIEALEGPDITELERMHVIGAAQWSRNRIMSRREDRIDCIHAVVVGHTPVQWPMSLGNVHYIDTGGWKADRDFTILDAATLRPAAGSPSDVPAGNVDFAFAEEARCG